MKTFDISFAGFTCLTIECEHKKTRNGFCHKAKLIDNGNVVCRSQVSYLNRTWESFEFETVIRSLLFKSKRWPDTRVKEIMDQLRSGEHSRINKEYGILGAVAKMGEILTDNKADSNKWKKRMLAAGLPLTFPPDWDSLSEDEKEKRLDKAIAFAQGKEVTP